MTKKCVGDTLMGMCMDTARKRRKKTQILIVMIRNSQDVSK